MNVARRHTNPIRLALLMLAFLPACEVLVPEDRPFAVFEGIPDWFANEFRKGGEGLSTSFQKLGLATERDAERLGEVVGGTGKLVDREIARGEEGLAWQAGVIGREFAQSTDATEQNVLGAPGWIAGEFEQGFSNLESFSAERWYRIRRDADTLGRQVTKFLTFLFR
ncbi:MAG: hypothetical protein H6834_11855 [Planctomycetes bacterium]|nr:hypothetical protein [Planctomycetota bacterium]